jgi:hypothetical protein
VGYGPLPRAASASPSAFGEAGVKFSPDQPRIPARNPGGGQWTSGGGGSPSGRVRLAQAGGRSGRSSAILARFPEATPEQEVRFFIAEASARNLLEQVRLRDPGWKPTPSLSSTIEGAISAAEAETREARARLAEIGGGRTQASSARSLEEVCTPGGVRVGKQGKNPKVSIVGRQEFDELLLELTRGAEEITPAEAYEGLWYRRADGTVFGLRRRRKSGLTIDIIDSSGNPELPPDTRMHFDD